MGGGSILGILAAEMERFLGLLNNFLMSLALDLPKVVGLGGMGLCALRFISSPSFICVAASGRCSNPSIFI